MPAGTIPDTIPGTPSPLAGEGARRAGEGHSSLREIESPPRVKRMARSLRHRQTEFERRMWALLRDRQFEGYKFRRQVPLGPYVVDFVCFDTKLVIELDGSQHAESGHDRVRDKWLQDDGYEVLRIWNSELVSNRASVGAAIWAALHRDPSSGAARHLLPQGEKGTPNPLSRVRSW